VKQKEKERDLRRSKGKDVEVDCTRPLEKGEKPPEECKCKEKDKHGHKLPNACIVEDCERPLKEG